MRATGPLCARVLSLALATVVGGCGSEPPKQPCKRGATVEVRVVDNDSPHMKRLYREVPPDASAQPQAPAAAAAGIMADTDHWSVDATTSDGTPIERITQTDYFLYAFDRDALERYVHAFGAPGEGREILFEQVSARPTGERSEPRAHWRTQLVHSDAVVTTANIVDVRPSRSPDTNAPMLTFTLTPDGRETFARRTAQLVGKKVAVVVDGTVLNAPIVNSAISGGRFSLLLDDEPTARTLLAKLACVK